MNGSRHRACRRPDRRGASRRRPHRRGAGRAAAERLRTAWRLVREFSGERAYEIYAEHQRRHHPGDPVLSEREFWRRHTDARDENPRTVCC